MQPVTAAAHVFPYVPTQILMPPACLNESTCSGADLAYIFSQSDDGAVRFSALNYSNTLGADAQLTSITTDLPFLQGEPATTAFGAARISNGSVVVYSGACDGTTGSLWSYSTGLNNEGSSAWSKKTTTPSDQGSSRGPYFLGGTLAFSSRLAPTTDQPTIYTYGGMCNSPGTNSTSWQSSANYTKTMMSLAPNSQAVDTAYALSVASTAGPRTPIAGFTLTQLPASMKNISGSITQEAGFVLLGGHTQQAFINMSTAAVWNLPEQSWSYINIGGPETSGNELAGRNNIYGRAIREVESRSGHTAVLSEDGASIFVFGGWVGDVNTPAEPQLAVLQLSQTYSSWKWTVPRAQPDGKGVYGHGAAMLPGNVMIVYGGWETAAPPVGTAMRRQASSVVAPRFLNMTTMSWSNSYTNPTPGKLPLGKGNHDAPAGDGSEQSRRLGLGLGLGLGLLLLLGIILALFRWRIRLKNHRRSREDAAQAMAKDAQYFVHDTDEMIERDDAYPWYVPRNDGYAAAAAAGDRSLGYESLRGARASLDDGHGRPTITRKPVMSRAMRGGYVPAETRLSAFVSPPGRIHPIMEDDEEEHHNQGRRTNEQPLTPTSEVHSDPFLTPITATAPPVMFPPGNRSSATPSPEGRHYDPDVQDWVSDVDAADTLLDRYNTSRQGRKSPTRRNSARSAALRDDESRSGSNLSESNRSAADSLRRSHSNRRSGASSFFGGMLLGAAVDHPKPSSSSSSSYNTARSGFGALQAEGPALLTGTTPSNPNPNYEDEDTNAPSSPSKTKPRKSWLGSLGRVFSQSGGSPPTVSPELSPTRQDVDLYGGDYEPSTGLRGELLRRKQGRQDWEDHAANQVRDGVDGGPSAAQENEWDIERAVEQRLVQVMFTVPKERLRVVNGGEEPDSEHEPETLSKRAQLKEANVGELPEPHVAEIVDPDKSSSESIISAERERERGRHSHIEDPELLHVDTVHEGRRSHSTDDSGRRSSGAVFLAEAVRFEKPRGRVLEMVDSIESRSQEGSQSGSPTRGK
ncbi:hypothetical protein QQS21_000211 [Conoideocrella luteorostrata]|uniref:Galactose oxidase n=1 Tax=Conoideocrella luteorostrata TaxID=1105319 RepID=A0AAJ0FYP5_9HYPO|nr:hypothetical protein QQS21_000211 [Conoideocrella luteorostrata]